MNSDSEHRYRIIKIDMCAMADYLKGGSAVGYDAIPLDAKVVGCRYSEEHHSINLVIESAEFHPVAEAFPIPWIGKDPIIHYIWKKGLAPDKIDKILKIIRCLDEVEAVEQPDKKSNEIPSCPFCDEVSNIGRANNAHNS